MDTGIGTETKDGKCMRYESIRPRYQKCPGKREEAGIELYLGIQNCDILFKTPKLFMSGTSNFIFSDDSWLGKTETVKIEIINSKGLDFFILFCVHGQVLIASTLWYESETHTQWQHWPSASWASNTPHFHTLLEMM